MSEKEAFENNQVLLWGTIQAKKSLLDKYDTGNKNPNSRKRKDKEEKPKIETVKEFNLNTDYGVEDLPFLNKEYERIEELLSTNLSKEDNDLYENLQEKLYDLIEGLEAMEKIQGKGLIKHIEKPIEKTIEKTIETIKIGKGFKKGSPEALAHAAKMREAREKKAPPAPKAQAKARVEKGSDKAKELGQRLAEARKAKKQAVVKPVEEVKEKPKKGKPWYYIGEIPKGYREATEDEAITHKKVSKYGKYVVDEQKYILFRDYNILLSEKASNFEVQGILGGLKKRIYKSLNEIEILKSKLDNDKYKDRWDEFKNKLANEKELRKYLQAGWNWYYKLYCERTGKKYERQKFELKEQELKPSSETPQIKEKEVQIDIRTGKPAETIEEIEKAQKAEANKPLQFIRGKEYIELKRKYFDDDFILKPKYSKQLFDKNIIIEKKYYPEEDYKEYVYHRKLNGNGFIRIK